MNIKETIKFCQNLMDHSEIVVFTSIDDQGYPLSRAMFNFKNAEKFPTIQKVISREDDPFYSIFATNTSSKKIRELSQNSKATVFYCTPNTFQSISLTGTVIFRNEAALKKELWVDGWEMYYSKGYTDPDFQILQLIPQYGRGWSGSGKIALKIKYKNDVPEYEIIQP